MIFENDQNDRNMAVLKLGEVVEVLPDQCKARVVFDEDDSIVSDPLPIVIPNSIENRDFHLPDVGEDVLCLFGSAGLEDGFILGSIYAGEVVPPSSSADVRMVEFADGSKFTFDRSASTFEIEIGSTRIKLDRDSVNVEAPQRVSVTSDQAVDIEGAAVVNIKTPTLNLNVGGTIMQLNGSSATITSQDLTFRGNVSMTGNLSVSGNGTFSGTVHAPNVS
ncbi:phage baseplate assembly protein V [uncultured Parasutterella sp.]|uniref:phage baseplate assembly protein V n=1 Tax=uncultured Parasutterella sp. TaxID=1263098 RepID=UPI0025917CD3|nr:phage baseplate assembly protein V [uncultured Parasutterella sp.]